MIVLFTDFGYEGPYVGQMKGVLARHAPNVPIIDLMHDAPVFNHHAAAYLLAAVSASFAQESVFLSVVDPGVGHPDRRPVLATFCRASRRRSGCAQRYLIFSVAARVSRRLTPA